MEKIALSRNLDNIYTLINNPFKLSSILIEFYLEYKNHHPKDILLSYLILPLVLNEESKQKLIKMKTTSSIRSLVKNKVAVAGLPERIEEYYEITNRCMEYAFSSEYLVLQDDLCVRSTGRSPSANDNDLGDEKKAAKNLVKIFKEYDTVAIYRLLGVKRL